MEEIKKELAAHYSSEDIERIAKSFDIDVTPNGNYVGIESLVDFLDGAAVKALALGSVLPDNHPQRNKHMEAFGAYATLSYVVEKSASHAASVLQKKAKEVAERN